MKGTVMLLTGACMLTALTVLGGSAAATSPPVCGSPDTSVAGAVNVWTTQCTGASVKIRNSICLAGINEAVGGVHVAVLYAGGCETGVWIEN